MARLFLYSPTRPLKTGTANYFKLFLQQLGGDYSQLDPVVVIDEAYYGTATAEVDDVEVLDYRQVQRQQDDITIYFLANNEYHRYIHHAVRMHRSKDGMAVAVIHEPAMWMNVQAMCVLREYGYSLADLEYFAAYEFGSDTKFMVRQFLGGRSDGNFQYASLGGTHIYEHCDVLVFHSHFAKAKFMLEKSPTYHDTRSRPPASLVMDHPPDTGAKAHLTTAKSKAKFVVGAFGWVKKMKQIDALILGYNDFYDKLDTHDKQLVRLSIVGEVDEERGFDPVRLAKTLGSSESITFYGYVTDKEIDELMAQTSVVFSLRFPSCGESSGPSHKAQAAGAALAVSDYAAFAETEAQYYIPVRKDLQYQAIVNTLQAEFQRYKAGPDGRTVRKKRVGPKNLSVTDMLDKIVDIKENGL